MFRQSMTKAARPAIRSTLPTRATFTSSARVMAEGDTGGTRPGGSAAGDAFSKREKASEDYAIKQREKEKLLELRKRLAEQHEHLKKLEEHIDEISRSQGGEQK